jgi:hypothetical protein
MTVTPAQVAALLEQHPAAGRCLGADYSCMVEKPCQTRQLALRIRAVENYADHLDSPPARRADVTRQTVAKALRYILRHERTLTHEHPDRNHHR